jgi:hypothetical protein
LMGGHARGTRRRARRVGGAGAFQADRRGRSA